MQMSGQTLVLKTKTKAVGSPGHFSSASRTRWGKVEGGKHLGKLTASCTPGCIDILIPGVWVPFPSGPPLVRGSKKVAKDLPFCLQPLTLTLGPLRGAGFQSPQVTAHDRHKAPLFP